MQLTKHTDYAFRILIYLAAIKKDQLTTIQQLTDSFSISKSHVMKIVNKLVHQEWVHATRGKFGGIRLGLAPSEISLREVVFVMEQTLEPVNCEEPVCALNTVCQLKGVLWEAQNQYLAHLDKFTLEDVINQSTTEVIHFISKKEAV